MHPVLHLFGLIEAHVRYCEKQKSKTRGLNHTHVELRPHALPRERKWGGGVRPGAANAAGDARATGSQRADGRSSRSHASSSES